MRRRLLLVLPVLLPGFAQAADPPTDIANAMPPSQLLVALRGGGHVIYVRHAPTQREGADQVSAVMGDCATQRMLSEEGWRQARAMGEAFRRLGIPVGAVISSEYCRAWQTADLAFGRFEKNPALNFEPAEDYTDLQKAAMRNRLRPLLSAAPPRGQNTVLVGHDDPFEAANGIYPEPMGVTWVIRPGGPDGFTLLGRSSPRRGRACGEPTQRAPDGSGHPSAASSAARLRGGRPRPEGNLAPGVVPLTAFGADRQAQRRLESGSHRCSSRRVSNPSPGR